MISSYLLPKGFFTCIDDIAFATFGYRFYSLFNIFFLVNSCLPSSSRTGATALNIFFPTQGKIDLADLASIPNIPPPPLLYLAVPRNHIKTTFLHLYVSIASFFAHFHLYYLGLTLPIIITLHSYFTLPQLMFCNRFR